MGLIGIYEKRLNAVRYWCICMNFDHKVFIYMYWHWYWIAFQNVFKDSLTSSQRSHIYYEDFCFIQTLYIFLCSDLKRYSYTSVILYVVPKFTFNTLFCGCFYFFIFYKPYNIVSVSVVILNIKKQLLSFLYQGRFQYYYFSTVRFLSLQAVNIFFHIILYIYIYIMK